MKKVVLIAFALIFTIGWATVAPAAIITLNVSAKVDVGEVSSDAVGSVTLQYTIPTSEFTVNPGDTVQAFLSFEQWRTPGDL